MNTYLNYDPKLLIVYTYCFEYLYELYPSKYLGEHLNKWYLFVFINHVNNFFSLIIIYILTILTQIYKRLQL